MEWFRFGPVLPALTGEDKTALPFLCTGLEEIFLKKHHPKETVGGVMDKRIFELGLSVEAISLYLIMADLEHSGVPLTWEPIEARWTGTREKLEQSMSELEFQNVIAGMDEPLKILSADKWLQMNRA
jgi:hypothetical protein